MELLVVVPVQEAVAPLPVSTESLNFHIQLQYGRVNAGARKRARSHLGEGAMGIFDGHWLYILVILAIVLIFWGPGKLPEVGAGLGRAIREFKKASSSFAESVTAEPPAAQSVVGHASHGETSSTPAPAETTPASTSDTATPTSPTAIQ